MQETTENAALPAAKLYEVFDDRLLSSDHTRRRVIAQNRKYYSRFPQDVAIVQRLVLHLHNLPGGGVRLPRGSFLTPHALQTLGMTGLGSAGGFERLHLLLERTFDGPDLSQNFLMVGSYARWR